MLLIMKNDENIPSHYYKEAVDDVQLFHRNSLLSPGTQFPFALTRFEFMSGSAQADYPHRHDYYEVLYIYEGEGTHIVDFESVPIQPHVFHFIAKGQVHFWQLQKPLKGYALLFLNEFLEFPASTIIRAHDFAFFHHVGLAPHLAVDPEQFPVFNGILEEMEQEFQDENGRSLTVLRAYLHILLTKLNRLYIGEHPETHAETTSPLVRQFNQLVSEHFFTEHAVQDYAKRMGISTTHLRDTVKAVAGYTPGQILRQKLAMEAKRLLAHSTSTISEIGYQLHFEDASYFARFFKRETGTTPKEFRRQIREQYRHPSD